MSWQGKQVQLDAELLEDSAETAVVPQFREFSSPSLPGYSISASVQMGIPCFNKAPRQNKRSGSARLVEGERMHEGSSLRLSHSF
eukprot:6467986-Amphidinium_carterae.3